MELDQHVADAVRKVVPWLTAPEPEVPNGADVEQRRRLALGAAGCTGNGGPRSSGQKAILSIAAAEVLLLALQVQLNLDHVGRREPRDVDRAIIDGDLLLARALAMTADLGAAELVLLAEVLNEISVESVRAPVVNGTQPPVDQTLNSDLVPHSVVRFAALAAGRDGRSGGGQLPIVGEPDRTPRTGDDGSDGKVPAWRPLVQTLGLGPLDQDLSRVETALVDLVEVPGEPELTEAMTYLVAAGGKRLRPLLVVIGHYAGQRGELRPVPQPTIEIAAAIEILHVFTLYHDDVIDSASTRRGVPTALRRWGERPAIGLGNALCARAFGAAGRLGQQYGQLMAASLHEVCRGQSSELSALFNMERSERDCLTSIGGKTAFLLGAAARFGAMTGGPDADPILDDIWASAFNYGMAFQIIDDLLDILSTESQLKKPVGTDITEGVYTLPVLLALREEPELRNLLSTPPTPDQIQQFRMRLAATGALAASVRLAVNRCLAARQIMIEASGVHPDVGRAFASFEDILFAPLLAAGIEVDR